MAEQVRMTTGVAQVLAVLLEDPRVGRYGLELMRLTGQPSGTLYPILTRLQAAGWLRAEWEDVDPSVEGRPARRYYLLTPDGVALGRVGLAELHAKLRPRKAGKGRIAGATTFTALGW